MIQFDWVAGKKGWVKILCTLLLCLSLLGCNSQPATDDAIGAQKIDSQTAAQMMETEQGYVLLDVRTQEEYAAGHIAGALLIPSDEIVSRAEEQLTDKEQMILVYCRSGRRSAAAAQQLVELGYTSVYDFGGIQDWPYEVVQE